MKLFHLHKWELYGVRKRYRFLGEPIYYIDPRLQKCSICGKIQYRPKGCMMYGTLTGIKKEIAEEKIRKGFFIRIK